MPPFFSVHTVTGYGTGEGAFDVGPSGAGAIWLTAAWLCSGAVQAVLALLQHGLCSPGGSAEHSHINVPGPAGQFLRLQWSPAHRAWGAVAGA